MVLPLSWRRKINIYMDRILYTLNSFSCLLFFIFFQPALLTALDPNRAITQYVHESWDMEDGLPTNSISSITQTSDGYLWLATSNGLVQFDGVNFKTFDSTNTKEIQFPEMMCVLADPDGTLWIANYWGGLISYKDGRFRRYGKSDGLSDERIVWLYRDKASNLWVATPNGLFRMRQNKFKKFWKEEGLPGIVVWAMAEDRSGKLMAGTVGGGLYQLNGEKFSKVTLVEDKDILALRKDSKGDLWVGTGKGLYRITSDQVKKYTAPKDFSGEGVIAFHEDHDGNLWIGTDRGLSRFHDEEFQSYTLQQGLLGHQVTAIHEDHEGNLWVATSAGGLDRFSNGKFITFSKDEGIEDEFVYSVFERKNGDILLGTGLSLSRLQNSKIENINVAPNHSHTGVTSVFEDSKGTVWLGTAGAGVRVLKNDKIAPLSTNDKLLGQTIKAIYEDRFGSLWVANFGYGLNRLENGEVKETFTVKDGLPTSYVLALHENKDGSLLIVTEDAGINRYKDGKFSVFISQTELGHQAVTIHIDNEGVIWMGSLGGGLKRYQNGKVVSIRKIHGLHEDTVGNILEDSSRNFWISSPKGIFTVSKKELNDFASGKISSVHCTPFGKSDGMKNIQCIFVSNPAANKSRDGKLWFPTVKGVVMIDPQRMRKNQIAPSVHVKEIIADGKTFDTASKIEMDPGNEKFELRYTALSFVDPKKVQLKYKLEGFDKEWVDAGTRRTAYYTNIPPRHYNFRVIASNNDGVWNEKGASVSFYLKPYFYQTSWFYVLCGITVLFVGSGIHRTRLKKVSAEFKAVIAERSRIAREIHDGLAQSLAGIVMQLETAQLISAKDKSQRHLDRALELARDGVQDARRAIGDLRPTPLEAQDFPFALRSMIQHQLQDTNISFHFDLTGTPIAIPVNVQSELLRICQESAQNVIKHSQAQSLRVKMNYDNETLTVSIQDDGRGFDVNSLPPAGHYGLSGIRERCHQLGADLSIQSSPQKGTLVLISVSKLNSNVQ